MGTEKTYNIHPDKLFDYLASEREYFNTIDGKKYCVAFMVYPSGYPVTSLAHAIEESADKTVCGIKFGSGKNQWYHDEWFGGIECKKCKSILQRKDEK